MASVPLTPSFRLDGRNALVTGGTKGIGFAAAAALAEAGAAVTIVGRDAEVMTAAVASLRSAGYDAEGVALDITDTEAVGKLVSGARRPFDILVNSAGTARHAPFLHTPMGDYQAVMALNVEAVMAVSQHVARRLVAAGSPGSIITISSQMAHVSGPNRSVYSASKSALEGLTRGMAIELGPHGIRANTICPTFILTDLTAPGLADEAFRKRVLDKIHLRRLGRVEDIMGPVVFLASEASSLITGSAIMVDGGWTAE